jgi:hypothetical protein
MSDDGMVSGLAGQLLSLRYVTLDQALTWRWETNPKRHDLDQLAASIRRYGFRDPSLYNTTLGGIPAGNGRLEALDLIRRSGEAAPRGVGLDADGGWCVPLVFGADAASRAAAEAFGVAHNNLTVVGFSAAEVARLWQEGNYLALLKRLAAADELPVTVDEADLSSLLNLLEEEPVVEAADDPGADLDHAEELQQKWATARGQLFGDKGYLSQPLRDQLRAHGVELITRLKSNMKNRLMSLGDKLLLRKRAVIESIIDQLKNISQIEHTRHRSPVNFMVHLVAGLLAYCFQPKKPSLGLDGSLVLAPAYP